MKAIGFGRTGPCCAEVIVAIVIAGLLAPRASADEAGRNLLENGGFEEGQIAWTPNPVFQRAAIEVVSGEEGKAVHRGRRALRVRNEGGWSNIYQQGGIAERTYELTFFARGGEEVAGADGEAIAPHVSVSVYLYGNTDKTGRSAFLCTHRKLKPTRLGPEWRQFKVRIKVSATQRAGARHFNLAMGTQGDVFLDEVVLREVQTWTQSLIFYLPFDDGFEAAKAGGEASPEMRGEPSLVQGRKGRAACFVDNANLVFKAEGNFDQAEGALAVWVKPYWSESDGLPHTFLEVPVLPEVFLDGAFVLTKGFSSVVQPNLFYFYNSPGHYNMSTLLGFEVNEWLHLACSWSTATKRMKLYCNGELLRAVQFERLGPRPSANGRPLVVGARLGGTTPENAGKNPDWGGHMVRQLPPGGGYGADAALDELMIFDRPLTDAEVAGLADAEATTLPAPKLYDASHISRLEQRLETPHMTFGRPSASGAVEALFVAPVGEYTNVTARDVVELAQRCDIDFTAVTVFGPRRLEWKSSFFRQFQGLSLKEKTEELMARLGEGPEVIVLANIDLSRLPRGIRSRLSSLVDQGTGLVVTYPYSADDPFFKQAAPEGAETIVAGAPLAGLDECFPGSDLAVKELGDEVVKTYRYGKGRVVRMAWSDQNPRYEVLAPLAIGGRWTREYEHRYNYYLSLVGKAVQWAAGRDPRARWRRLPVEGEALRPEQWLHAGLPVEVAWAGEEGQPATLETTVRDPRGRVEAESAQALSLRPGLNPSPIPLPQLKAGRHYLDLVLRSAGKVENWATVSFTVERPEQIVSLTTDGQYYRKGEVVHGKVRFREALTAPAQLNIRAVDTWGRVYNRAALQVPAEAKEAAFAIAADRPTTVASYIEVDVVRGGQVLSEAETVVFVPKRDECDFLAMMWTGFRGTDGVPGQIALRQLRQAGFNAVYHWDYGGDFHNDAMGDMIPVQYCCRMTFRPGKGGRLDAHCFPGGGAGIEDKSLDNPLVQDALRKLAAEVHTESGRLGPAWYSLGDENMFQAGFGYSPYGLKYFREFLKRRYGTIRKLNQEYGADYADFKDVPRHRGGDDSLPALIDHLLATDDEWAAFHQFLADEIRKLDPEARVGAEGSVAGDMERMLDGVQVWAPYGQLRHKLLLRSLAAPDVLRSHWWGSYRYEVVEYQAGQGLHKFWGFLLRGFANFLEYFAAFGIESIFNADLSFQEHFRDAVLPELTEILAGPAQLLSGARVVSDTAVAVHHSRVSHHASQALKDLATTAAAESTLLTTFDELGQDFRYVSPRQIAAGELLSPRASVLLLPSSRALSEEEAERIAGFVRDGGVVVADFIPGIISEYGRRLQTGRLDDVFGATCGGRTSPEGLHDLAIQADLWGESIVLSTPYTRVDAALTLNGAKPLAQAHEIPLLLINQYGRGRALLLNFDLSRFSRPLQAEFIAKLLRAAGVESQYRLEAPKGTLLSVLQRGEVDLLGVILPEGSEDSVGVSWAATRHVYDVRAGRYLGEVNRISLPSATEKGRVRLFALQAEPVSTMTVSAAEQGPRGRTLPVEVRFKAGGVSPKERLIRVDVVDPNGKSVPHYRDFIVLDAESGRFALPLAFNDAPGKWIICATDVVSGVRAEQAVSVR